METENSFQKFRLAVAILLEQDENADVEDSRICSESEVTSTRDTVDDFVARWGEPEIEDSRAGRLYYWENVQRAKGMTRGDLYVYDAGASRLAFFSGQ